VAGSHVAQSLTSSTPSGGAAIHGKLILADCQSLAMSHY
jgi:hypothetical protein